MNYIEAVRALKEGRCKGITRPGKVFAEGSYLILKVDPCTLGNASRLEWNTSDITYAYDTHILADDWILVGEKLKRQLEYTAYSTRLTVDVDEFIGRKVRITVETVD